MLLTRSARPTARAARAARNARARYAPIDAAPAEVVRPYRATYSEFLDKLEADGVSDVTIVPGSPDLTFVERDGRKGSAGVILDGTLLTELRSHGANVSIAAPGPDPFASFMTYVFPFLAPFAILALLMRRAAPGGNYDLRAERDTGVTFDDVAGIDAQKLELAELVDFLKNPDRYTAAGAKVPRGCLLSGPPGTGKTLLARAVAGEADVPFISCSASQFVELFVGLGASRIRGLFANARKKAPCIIFIDEIDAIGKQRGGALVAGGGNDEREQTLNQLLTEMDGFSDNGGVVILGATNRPDVIDPALLRPGRFDRKIEVSLPTVGERRSILHVHAANKILDSNVDLSAVAQMSAGFSGADLANLMNEAAILAARGKRIRIEKEDIGEAFDKITIGLPSSRVMSASAKRRVAYHEAGHALVGALLPQFDSLGKVTILPRGAAGGVTQFLPGEEVVDSGLVTRDYLESKIMVALGGRVAEEVVYGKGGTTTGASSDMVAVTDIATQMVRRFGFSRLGSLSIGPEASPDLLADADEEARAIVQGCYNKAVALVRDNSTSLEALCNLLVERETVDGSEVYECISRRN